jgi:hypothetical protein
VKSWAALLVTSVSGVALACLASPFVACGASGDSGSGDVVTADASEDVGASDAPADVGFLDAHETGTGWQFNVFDHIPMFNIYASTPPSDYTPPQGILMWQNGTIFVTKLSAGQKALIGADLAAQITYFAQCDDYDRIGGVFLLVEPPGQAPQPTDARIELVRFITPFSDYTKGPAATYVFPRGSLAAFANVLADPGRDVWIGMGGGSYPSYKGNPCTGLKVDAGSDFLEVGFSYSLDFVSSVPLASGEAVAIPAFAVASPPPPDAGTAETGSVETGASDAEAADGGSAEAGAAEAGATDAEALEADTTEADAIDEGSMEDGSIEAGDTGVAATEAGAPYAISNVPFTSTPVAGVFQNPGSTISGHVTVIVSGHGSDSDGDEYEYTKDTLSLGSLESDAGTVLGSFSTEINCAPYAAASPDGNPGIFLYNATFNPRNWCPGALVPSHTFPATLSPGSNDVVLDIDPGAVPSGSYFQTSITFTSP